MRLRPSLRSLLGLLRARLRHEVVGVLPGPVLLAVGVLVCTHVLAVVEGLRILVWVEARAVHAVVVVAPEGRVGEGVWVHAHVVHELVGWKGWRHIPELVAEALVLHGHGLHGEVVLGWELVVGVLSARHETLCTWLEFSTAQAE